MIALHIEISASIGDVRNSPKDIRKWNNINAEWHTPLVENALWPGWRFLYRMGLADGLQL